MKPILDLIVALRFSRSHMQALLLLVACLVPACMSAQTGNYLTTEKGLSSSVVKQIYQDHYGIIWIATNSGVNVYNGYQMRTYQRNVEQSNSLASNLVNGFCEDRDGKMLVATNLGVQKFDNEKFYPVKMVNADGQKTFYVNCMLRRRDGTIIFSTSGSGLWRKTGPLEARRIGGAFSGLSSTVTMIEDPTGTLYIASSDQGVWSLKGNRVMRFALPATASTPQSLCYDHQGNVYLGCINGGLYVKSRGSNRFVLVGATAGKHVLSLACTSSGNVLMGLDGAGVEEYHPTTGMVSRPWFYSNEVDLSTSKVCNILLDRQGNLWLSLMQKGVFIQPTSLLGFSYMGYRLGPGNVIDDKCVMALAINHDGGLWVSTDNGGLFLIGRDGKCQRRFLTTTNASLPHAILGMREDASHRLWVASYQEGCGWIDEQTGAYHRLHFTLNKASSVFDVEVDPHDNLWIGTMSDGLKRLNLKTQQLTEYYASNRPNSIYNNYIMQLHLSADKTLLYVCTTGGLSCLDLRRNSWTSVFGTNCLLRDHTVYDVTESPDGHLWVATPDGLYAYTFKTRQLKRYSTEQGLASNIVTALLTDSKRRIWMSTNNGMSCLDPATGKVSNFYRGDGLQGNEFSDGVAVLDSRSGIMVFGGMNGVTWFNPLRIQQRKHKLPLYLTSFLIGDQAVHAGTKSGSFTITDKSVEESTQFDLSFRDNSFTIGVSSLVYSNPESVTYYYCVNGEKWTAMPRGKNMMTFAHLESGTYHIQVMAKSNMAESDVKNFTVTIHPVWFLSLPAKLFYLLFVCYLIYIYLRNLKRKQQAHLRLQEHIHAEQMSEAKLRFFINLSHDIRTPMTLILTPLLSLMKEDKDPGRQNVYALMKRNAERILHLINQMMDLRKIDKGQMEMHFSETDLVAFTKGVMRLFQIQAEKRQINLQLKADSESVMVWIDRTNFDKVLMNLLSNAFKFTHTGGNILITIRHDDKNVRITVADDGDTIPEDKIDRIFERFYQGSTIIQGRQSGTGVGLDLARSITELHHGTISARNTENPKGCAFDIDLPLGHAHLKPQEMVTAEEQRELESQFDLSQLEDDETELQPAPVEDLAPTADGNRPHIVVVDDEDDIRHFIAQQLKAYYHVTECSNGKDALAIIQRDQPALVVTDVMMPEMDGFTLCAKLKANINTNHIPVVLLTAKGRDEDKTEGIELGADAYISKPFSMDLLRSTIGNLLRGRALLRNKYLGHETMEKQVEEVKLQNPDDKLLERVVHVINNNLPNEDFNVDQLADEVGISRVHLYRKMKELTNQTPSEFIRNVRLKQAANLLSDSHQSISEVMYACGFSNRASFSTMFKKFYGLSPRDYMQEAQKKNN